MYIKVKAWPDFSKEKISRLAPDKFEIWLREPADRNMANQRIFEILSKEFGVPKNQIKMINGHRKQSKLFFVNE